MYSNVSSRSLFVWGTNVAQQDHNLPHRPHTTVAVYSHALNFIHKNMAPSHPAF